MSQSNKRYFNTFFFEDPYIEDLDYHTRYLYLTMILNPHNNLAGVYEISINKFINYTGMPDDKVRLGIQKLQEDGKILFSGNWLSLKNFIKNNELNSNMCKNSFDIMRAAPKDKIIFIISDKAGNAEPWLSEFVSKIEKGINQAIDSKNRNALKYAQDRKLPEPALEQHQLFNMKDFTSVILDDNKHVIRGTLPPTLPFHGGEPSGEYKGEIEYEVEEEREIEIGNGGGKEFSGFKQSKQRSYTDEYKILLLLWNSLDLPECRKLYVNLPNWGEIMNSMKLYTLEEIQQAIDNYHKLRSRKTAISYSTFPNFLIRGIEKYADSSIPFDNFKETQDEKKNTINTIPNYIPEEPLTNEEIEKRERLIEDTGGISEMFKKEIKK